MILNACGWPRLVRRMVYGGKKGRAALRRANRYGYAYELPDDIAFGITATRRGFGPGVIRIHVACRGRTISITLCEYGETDVVGG